MPLVVRLARVLTVLTFVAASSGTSVADAFQVHGPPGGGDTIVTGLFVPTGELDATASTGVLAQMKTIDPVAGAAAEQDWLDGKIRFASYLAPPGAPELDTVYGVHDWNTLAVNSDVTSYAWAYVFLHEYGHAVNAYPPPGGTGYDVTTSGVCGSTCTHAIKTGKTILQMKEGICSDWSIPLTQLQELCELINELVGVFALQDLACQEAVTDWMCSYPGNMPDVGGACEICDYLGY